MSHQPHSAYDLLGLAQPAEAVWLPEGEPPQLELAWNSFDHHFSSSIWVVFGLRSNPKDFRPVEFFNRIWMERRAPRRAVIVAALWHVALFIFPWPESPATPRPSRAFDDVELTWSGPIRDLPLLDLPGRKETPSPRGEPDKPLPPKGADAFHPRQRIITDPVRPTHPRQTLIHPAAPPEAPKILPHLPNIVQLPPAAQPARPRMAISAETLAKLRPRETRRAAATDSSTPDLPNLEPKLGDLSVAASSSTPARPRLQINPASAPRFSGSKQSVDAGAAPDLGPALPGAAGDSPAALIALSASPAAPSPNVEVPAGNLSARISISPEGTQRGVPGGAANGVPGATGGAGGGPGSRGGAGTGGGGNAPAVSISGGNPEKSSVISGLGGRPIVTRIQPGRSLPGHPQPKEGGDAAAQSAPRNVGLLPPGAKPEELFGSKQIHTLYVNMPNLNSVTGSWILNFSELLDDPYGRPAPAGELTGPVPVRKIDPKYPPTLMQERVEGEVILYAVIRRDGSVDSIQLIRGIDEDLDRNAMEALARWKFQPAHRQGAPVELEAIVHIPFRAVARPY